MNIADSPSTKTLGYIELMVSYDNDPLTRMILSCPSVYNCIIGRPTLGRIEAVDSTIHLKIKFYSATNKVVTMKADLGAAKRCHFLSLKKKEKSNRGEAPNMKNKEPQINYLEVAGKKRGEELNMATSSITTPSASGDREKGQSVPT